MLQIKPARAKDGASTRCNKEGNLIINDSSYFAEQKLDGRRFLCHFGNNLPVSFTSRHKSKGNGLYIDRAINVPHLHPTIDTFIGLTIIDGEIMHPNGRNATGSCMGASEDKALAFQEENGKAFYYPFDILYYNGEDVRDLPYFRRRDLLLHIMKVVNNKYWKLPLSTYDSNEDMTDFYDRLISDDEEGVIIKSKYTSYGKDWWKWKWDNTVSVIITGFTEGKAGKYEEMIGAIVFGVYDNGKIIEIGQCSGMTDEERKDFTDNQDYYLGKVIEVRAQEITKNNRLGHPRFLHVRDDYSLDNCTWDSVLSAFTR